ncbi:MoxR family ATPase [Fodinicurvata sp. EGI_FJ10296]|uniref:AAA family ATPase n=1 Tax=Fodinicurvata sp. EGI_FJ10296 TaxID=3231908 RepID=UPI003453B632
MTTDGLIGEKSAGAGTGRPVIPDSVDETIALLAGADYMADRSLATALFLSLKLNRPLFLEGEAGVGKTEIAKVLSKSLNRRLVRLQCYEGLDVSAAVYEWNYQRQMLEIRLAEAAGNADKEALADDLFSEKFLIRRPLLQALECGEDEDAPVLLIDELDRTDEPFEAYLLEILSDFQVSIPEIGTIRATKPPIVIVTSNRTREIHDALKRRCFYHWVDYPDADRERRILTAKATGTPAVLSAQIVGFVQKLRQGDLFKSPGVAETLDWAQALSQLDVIELDPEIINDTLGTLLKYQDDIDSIRGTEAGKILAEVRHDLNTTLT